MIKYVLLSAVIMTLAACTSVPVALTYADHSLSGYGSSSSDMSTFTFEVTDNQVACQGSYSLAPSFAPRFTFPISCSDGSKARVEARRDIPAMDKPGVDYPVLGKVVFSDGSYGMFNLGSYARGINTNSLIYIDFMEDLRQKKSN